MAPRKRQNQQAATMVPDCVAARIRVLSRVITKIYDEALRPLGVKTSQLNIVVVAASLGVARAAEVCEILHLDTSTLSRNVERMRAKGWLETVPDQDDGRLQPFRLTAKGRELMERAEPAWRRAQREAEALVGPGGLALLKQVTSDLGCKLPTE